MRKRCEEILLKLGITPDLSGFNYIADAVEMINKNQEIKITLMYREIARKYDKRDANIERAIRHAISGVNPNGEAYKKYINANLVKETSGAMNNGAFLHTLAYRVREDNKDEN